ncbi:GNAT family N-acetyltransferase [Nocardioides bigeumensis]|uniref:N-acetyltransferase domain-containing protein n=1 Tax=Nocardioides bigeumensis TaxID=433657 RepID=A0ABN2Y9V4_9ACTN
MDVRSLAWQTDLAIARLAGSEVEDRGDHIVVRTPANPTYYWGNFHLLESPPTQAEVADVLARFDADFPGSEHKAIGVDGVEDQTSALGPLVAAGLTLEIATVMTASSVHPPPRPNRDATYRQLETDHDWAQRIELGMAVDTEYDPVKHRVFLTRKAEHDRALCAAGHGTWWGAFVGDDLASVMGLVEVETSDSGALGRYQSVETHPDFRGRGLAGTLVHRVATYGLEERGLRTLVMVADPEYLAIRIYRSVGFDGTEIETQLLKQGY